MGSHTMRMQSSVDAAVPSRHSIIYVDKMNTRRSGNCAMMPMLSGLRPEWTPDKLLHGGYILKFCCSRLGITLEPA